MLELFAVALMTALVSSVGDTVHLHDGEATAVPKEFAYCGDHRLPGVAGLGLDDPDGRPLVLLTDALSWKPYEDKDHLWLIGVVANNSFARQCEEWSNEEHPIFVLHSLPSHYDDSELAMHHMYGHYRTLGMANMREVAKAAKQHQVKVIAHSAGPATYAARLLLDELEKIDYHPLVLQAAGNSFGNLPAKIMRTQKIPSSKEEEFTQSLDIWYHRKVNTVRGRMDGRRVSNAYFEKTLKVLKKAIERRELLFVTGHAPDGRAAYSATTCGMFADGCVAAPYGARIGKDQVVTGTSFSAPMLAMALASIWKRYPDLSRWEMYELVRECAIGPLWSKTEYSVHLLLDPSLLMGSLMLVPQWLRHYPMFRSSGFGRADFQCLYHPDNSLKSLSEVREIVGTNYPGHFKGSR